MIQIVRPRTIIEEICGIGDEPQFAAVQSPQPADALLTEEQAARIAGVSRKQIRKMILAGRLEAVDWGTGKRKHYRIKADALAALQARPGEPRVTPRQRRRVKRFWQSRINLPSRLTGHPQFARRNPRLFGLAPQAKFDGHCNPPQSL